MRWKRLHDVQWMLVSIVGIDGLSYLQARSLILETRGGSSLFLLKSEIEEIQRENRKVGLSKEWKQRKEGREAWEHWS